MEFVVVDDCSTDGSPQLIRDILARIGTDGVRFIQHEENRGQMAAMLSGLDATTAPFVAWLDADDVWFPEYIERHVALHLNSQINAAITTSNLALIDNSGTLIAGANPGMSVTSPLRKWGRTSPITAARLLSNGSGINYGMPLADGPVAIRRNYEPWVWSSTSGIVFRRTTLEAIRPPEPHQFRTCADHYLARFSHVLGGTIWTGETLGFYRHHGSNHFVKQPIYGDVIRPRA
jgi:glycosyltransferase involved in cell wall biosynthesis